MEPDLPTQQPTLAYVEFTELDGYLPNPFMGWQDSRLKREILPETVAYDRFDWAELNPAPGVYDWSPIEELRAIKGATGRSISFRVRTSRPAPFGNGPVIPAWVTDLGARIFAGSEGDPEPLYSDCTFLETHAEFIDGLRQRYDGDPDLAFLDIGSYGYFGEWDSEQYNEQIDSLDWHARRRIIDMYLGGYATRPCSSSDGAILNVSYTYAGFQSTQLIMPYTPWFEDSLIYALEGRQDIGIRNDALGSERHQGYIEERAMPLFERTWRHAPIIFEFSSKSHTPEALSSAREFARRMHATFIHDYLVGRGKLVKIEAVLDVVGYRLVLRQAGFQTKASAGHPLQIELHWVNHGSAPPYRFYPLEMILIDGSGSIVLRQTLEADIRTWLPGNSILIDQHIDLPADLPPGDYQLKLAFVDEAGSSAITLANDGRDSSGAYPLGSVEITP